MHLPTALYSDTIPQIESHKRKRCDGRSPSPACVEFASWMPMVENPLQDDFQVLENSSASSSGRCWQEVSCEAAGPVDPFHDDWPYW